jgi:hypothetical protein
VQGRAKRRRVQQIRSHRYYAIDIVWRVPRQSVNPPSPFTKVSGEIIADDAAGSDD